MQAGPILETVLYAGDITAARDFYAGLLGLDVYSEVEDRFVFFRLGGQMLLIFNPDVTSVQDGDRSPPPHGTQGAGHVCFRATAAELAEWRKHLRVHGIAIERELDWPKGGHSIYFRDPAGNSVEFAEGSIWGIAE